MILQKILDWLVSVCRLANISNYFVKASPSTSLRTGFDAPVMQENKQTCVRVNISYLRMISNFIQALTDKVPVKTNAGNDCDVENLMRPKNAGN